jgi:GMP synthase-like glutamine amidotransferase
MKPVAIFRHAPHEGPAYFATWLERHGVPMRLVKLDEGEPVPTDARTFSGIAFMGGPMSVHDDLPWIAPVLALIRDAVAAGVPVIGHCLGGQLMAKALGGEVTRNPVKEIGWGRVKILDNPQAVDWFGAPGSFLSFHWHGEMFSVPPGATRVLSSEHCANQAFVLGPHIGMQCHVEMTPELIESWCRSGAREIARSPGPGVQSVEDIRFELDPRVNGLHRVADLIYEHWARGLARG